MRPVSGLPDTGDHDSRGNDKKATKREADKAGKIRRDDDGFDEIQLDGHTKKSRKSEPKIKMQTSSKDTGKALTVAPNSTTYTKQTSTDPRLRPSSKRDVFQGKVKREKASGIQDRHRKRNDDLRSNHPELLALRGAQLSKDRKGAPPSLDPVKLVGQARASDGHIDVNVKDKKDAKVLVSVLSKNPSIRSLKLVCDFGGRPDDPYELSLHTKSMHDSDLGFDMPVLLDDESFRSILNACKSIRTLNVSGCRLTSSAWKTLAEGLELLVQLRRLELGGGDHLTPADAFFFGSKIASANSSLQELVIDELFTDSLPGLLVRLSQHGKFTLIKLTNIRSHTICFDTWTIESIFGLCACNPKLKCLSMAGTRSFKMFAANDEIHGGSWEALFGAQVNTSMTLSRHESLRLLDLSDCGLNFSDMGKLAKGAEGSTTLLDIRIEGNAIADADRATLMILLSRNREALEKRVDAALTLLIRHAASQIDTWPAELIGVLIENTPPEVLLDIAAVIQPAGGLPARSPDTTGARGQSSSSGSPKPQ
jgi:hypothetical protein